MGVLNSSIATGTDDKLSLIFNTLFEHHVCSHPTSMETHSQGKFLMEIVLIALKQKNQNLDVLIDKKMEKMQNAI